METFFAAEGVPVFCNVLWDTPEAAAAAPRGDIRLGFCGACSLIYNQAFKPLLVDYRTRYENSLYFSPTFRAYAEQLAGYLARTYRLQGKQVIEIGSGTGEFLASLCRLGDCQGVGFDPSQESRTDGPITVVPEYFSARHRGYRADLVVSRHVLEHVADPQGFLTEVRGAIEEGTPVFFEVPNSLHIVRDVRVWDVIYEHCSYFTAPSLERLFTESGFRVERIFTAFGDQYLCVEAVAGDGAGVQSQSSPLELRRLVERFAQTAWGTVGEWRERLDRWTAEGRRSALWGVGSKGVMFLTLVEGAEALEAVVDVNPRKQSRYVPGRAKRVLPPEALAELAPSVVVVMNRIYGEEIAQLLGDLGIEAELAYA